MRSKKMAGFFINVLGMNRRNLSYIYAYNPHHYLSIADDKSLTKELLSRLNIPVPPSYCLIPTMGEIHSLWNKLCQLDEFVIKPAKGSAGGGILVLEKAQGETWSDPSGQLRTKEELIKHMADILFGVYSSRISDKVIIEYRVHSHPVFKRFFPKGVADIRIIVFNDIPRMAMARMPTYKSKGRANLHQGAIGVSIDLERGCMGDGYDYKGYINKHPDTNVEFSGVQIPFWKEIIQISQKTSQAVPLKYIGIDIVVDAEKGPLVMEINARPGLEIQNVNRKGLREILEAG